MANLRRPIISYSTVPFLWKVKSTTRCNV